MAFGKSRYSAELNRGADAVSPPRGCALAVLQTSQAAARRWALPACHLSPLPTTQHIFLQVFQ